MANPWRDRDPGLPIAFGQCSNGEYEPERVTPARIEMARSALREVEFSLPRVGLSRREFLRSASALAICLGAIDSTTARAMALPPGRWYPFDPDARLDNDVAHAALGPRPFIFDVQGHLLEYDLDPSTRGDWFWGRQFPQAQCSDEDDPRACFSANHFLEEIFVRSDTTMVALSGLPIHPEGSPLSPEVMEETRRLVVALSGDERVLVNALSLPQLGPLESVFDEMERTVSEHRIHGWKTFTHFPSPWWLDDHDPDLPQVGDRFLTEIERLGTPTLFVHKGLSGGARRGSPEDVGPAARAHPDVRFVVYHSGFEVSQYEGPFTAGTAHLGVNRLVQSVRQAGVGPGENVYAEIGSTWWHLLRRPEEAAHVLGKLLLAFGEDNVLWGTDSIFYGSPQGQIDALRAFRIPSELSERFGYPELTDRVKAKIFGWNAAALYGIDPIVEPLHFTFDELDEARSQHPVPTMTWGPSTPREVRDFRLHHRGWP